MKNEVSRTLWLVIPLAMSIVQIGLESLPEYIRAPLMSEQGPHELLQALAAAAGLCVALFTMRGFPFGERPWLAAWFALAAICCLYAAGEEISWGQQLFHWATPGYWDQV